MNKPTQEPRRRKWSSSAVVAFFVLLVCLPLASVVFVQIKKEIARWHWAAAINSRNDKRFDDAAESLELALQYDPGSAKLILARAYLHLLQEKPKDALADLAGLKDLTQDQELKRSRIYMRLGKYKEALQGLSGLSAEKMSLGLLYRRASEFKAAKHYDKAIADVDNALARPGLSTELRHLVIQLKATILLKQEKVSEALKELKQIVPEAKKLGDRQYAQALNTLAYHRSLANTEIGKAIVDINKALRLCKESERAAYLDTRGWVYFRAGKHEQALADLHDAIKLFRPQYESSIKTDPDDKESKKHMAVFLQHRSAVYTALREHEKAAADRQEIKELGFDPDKDLD